MTAFPPAPQDRIDIEKLIAHFGDRDVAEITEGDIFIAAHKICADTSNANKNRRVVAPAATILHFAAREEMRSWVRYNKLETPLPAPRAISIQKANPRSEEHTSELQSLMRISYAVFFLK